MPVLCGEKDTLKKVSVNEKEPYSVHLIADLEGPKFIEDAKEVERILWEAAKAANNTPLQATVYKFPVQGITGVILLAESHIAIHTWPEHDYIAVDIFTCGRKTQPEKALEYFIKVFKPRRVKSQLIDRGLP
jgi:S-adenosylmethionine decarboxylase